MKFFLSIKKKHEPVKCLHCGVSFVPKKPDHKVCTHDCRQAWRKKKRYEDRVTKACDHCGKPFLAKNANHRFCCAACSSVKNVTPAVLKKSVCGDLDEYKQMELNNKGFELWFNKHTGEDKWKL
jgi:hypothetical protein